MKATLELPDSLLKEAQASAERIGLPLGDFVAEAIQSKLEASCHPTSKPWMKHFGTLRHLHTESKRIEQIITDEYPDPINKIIKEIHAIKDANSLRYRSGFGSMMRDLRRRQEQSSREIIRILDRVGPVRTPGDRGEGRRVRADLEKAEKLKR